MDGSGTAADPTTAEFDDTELKCLLLGSEKERRQAGNELFRVFNHRLMGKLREFFWLSDEEKASVIHDTILEILVKAERVELDFDKPLVGLLLWICKCKAIDLSRKKRRNTRDEEELSAEIAETVKDTQVGLAWQGAVSNEEVAALRAEFQAFVATLPPQQQLVGGIMADHLAFALSTEEMCEKIYRTSGKAVSKFSVKGALSEIRAKFETLLKRKYPHLPL